MKQLMTYLFLSVLTWMAAVLQADVVIENPVCRLVISAEGHATSLVEKSTGEELLVKGARTPFATLLQNRAYDNEYKLMMPAKPWTHRANRITRTGDELRIEFEDEFDVAVLKIREESDFIGFELSRIDYRFEDFGDKRKTEIDGLQFLRLPLRRRACLGRGLNVTHDDRVAAAVMAARCETRVDAEAREDGGLLFWAGTEKKPGILNFNAILAVTAKPRFLDAVDHMERVYDLPRGVESRRRADAAEACYYVTRAAGIDLDREIARAKQGGFRLMMFDLQPMVTTCGSYEPHPKLAGGRDFFRTAAAKCRAAGIELALHNYSSKADVNDPLVRAADPRFATVTTLVLAEPIGPETTELKVEGNRNLLRHELNRTLLKLGDELVMFGEADEGDAQNVFTLKSCRRGVYGTRVSAHARGAEARHLDVDDWPKWIRFDPDTSIQAEAAARIAAYWKDLGCVGYYYDGAEDVPDPYWYYVPKAQLEVHRRLDPVPRWSQSALKSHFGWHLNSHGNAFDIFPPERLRQSMKKYVLRCAAQDAEDFTRVDLGWLRLKPPAKTRPQRRAVKDATQFHRIDVDLGIGMQPDHIEYVFAKALAWDCPVTIQFAERDVAAHPLLDELLAIMRRWQAVRRAGRVSADLKAAMRDPAREFILLNDDPEHPDIAECRMITSDEERPYRALAYTKGGKRHTVYWHLFERDFAPEARFGTSSCGRLGNRRIVLSADDQTARCAIGEKSERTEVVSDDNPIIKR